MDKVLQRQGNMFIFSGPSGGGKSSVIKGLLQRLDNVVLSVSVTTRAMREGEVEGKDYYFISDEKFEDLVKNNALYEYVNSDFGSKYGTPKGPVDKLLESGVDVILDLDYPGVQQLRKLAGDCVKAISLLPPSIKILEERLVNRKTDSKEVIAKRMGQAGKRIKESVFYDYVIVNDDLENAISQAEAIVRATRAERKNICNLDKAVQHILEN